LLLGSWIGVRLLSPDSNPKLLFSAAVCFFSFDFIRALLITLLFRYEATTTHVSTTTGILSRRRNEVPLARIQHVEVRQTFLQRLLSCGSIGLTAADGVPVSWSWVDDPNRLANVLRTAITAASRGTDTNDAPIETSSPALSPVSPLLQSQNMAHSFRTIGLVGGIGAGKSAVASILADLGYLVFDADKDAKAALDRPDVRGFLISWWGSQIVGSDGKVDRRAVGEIIFAKPEERRKLEALVHPIVRADRTSQIATARRDGCAGVVIDAPLLFEAGSDADCDAVLFVDAPYEHRLRRVLGRGWSADELDRREAAQLSLAEKRRRSSIVIVNDADLATLRERVHQALSSLDCSSQSTTHEA